MFGRLVTKLMIYALQKADISLENRNLLTTCVLDKLVALPFHDIIKVNEEGILLINENPVDMELARKLRESARGALNNTALKLIRDQVTFTAITVGVHKLEKTEQSFFARAAIWFGQQELSLLEILAQAHGGDRELNP